jgi:hypothetical protein
MMTSCGTYEQALAVSSQCAQASASVPSAGRMSDFGISALAVFWKPGFGQLDAIPLAKPPTLGPNAGRRAAVKKNSARGLCRDPID